MTRHPPDDHLKVVELNTSKGNDSSIPEISTGLACLVMMARLHGVAAEPDQLAHEHAGSDQSFGTLEILLAAKRLKLQAKAVKVSPDRLAKTPLPALAVGKCVDGKPIDFFILACIDGDQVLIQSPTVGRPEKLSLVDLQARWSGELILFTSRASLAGEMSKFDFTWFVPSIVKYRKLLGEVLLVSFVLQFFALITPLFFQVVMEGAGTSGLYHTGCDCRRLGCGGAVRSIAHCFAQLCICAHR